MPPNMVDTAADEKAWKRAKKRAAKQGHAEDWPYVVRIFQSMAGKGTAKGIPGIPANLGPNAPRLDPAAGMGDASTWIMRSIPLAKGATKGSFGPLVDVLRKATVGEEPVFMKPSGSNPYAIVSGIKCYIENVPGTERKGYLQTVTYGEVIGTNGADGEPFDAFLGQNYAAPMAFVIDQLDEDGEVDEHKSMLGFDTAEDAARAYVGQMPTSFMGGMVAIAPMELQRFLLNHPNVSAEPFAALLDEAGVPYIRVWAPLSGMGAIASPSVVAANGGA